MPAEELNTRFREWLGQGARDDEKGFDSTETPGSKPVARAAIRHGLDENGVHSLAKPAGEAYKSESERQRDPASVLEDFARNRRTAGKGVPWKPGRELASHSEVLARAHVYGAILHPPSFRGAEAGGNEHALTFDARTGRYFKPPPEKMGRKPGRESSPARQRTACAWISATRRTPGLRPEISRLASHVRARGPSTTLPLFCSGSQGGRWPRRSAPLGQQVLRLCPARFSGKPEVPAEVPVDREQPAPGVECGAGHVAKPSQRLAMMFASMSLPVLASTKLKIIAPSYPRPMVSLVCVPTSDH